MEIVQKNSQNVYSVTGRKLDVKILLLNPALHGTKVWIWITSVLKLYFLSEIGFIGGIVQHQNLEKYWIR